MLPIIVFFLSITAVLAILFHQLLTPRVFDVNVNNTLMILPSGTRLFFPEGYALLGDELHQISKGGQMFELTRRGKFRRIS